MKRILLLGGGTGGHVYPLAAVAEELQKIVQEKGINLELMAMADGGWRSEFESRGIKFKGVFAPKLRRVEGGRLNFFSLLAMPLTLIQALWLIFVFMPDFVFSKGSFTSLMPSFAAWLYFIPVFIHESDSVPGTVNRLVSKLAKKIFVSFENAASYFPARKTVLSGNPVRVGLLNGNKEVAQRYFNLDSSKKTVLFLAGSQGAVFINNLIMAGLVEIVKDFQIIHQVGNRNFDSVNQEVEKVRKEGASGYGVEIEKNYRVFAFLNEEGLKNAYAASDVIVSRSGSNIFEIAGLSKPAIVIPYPYSAKNHQKENAKEFSKYGAVILEEQNLKPHILIDQIRRLANDSSAGEKIRRFAKLDAGRIIAEEMFGNLKIENQ